MDTNYFLKTRILDGGMGQELLAKGLKAKGSLWSATALIEEKYHQLVIDAFKASSPAFSLLLPLIFQQEE